MKTGRVEVLGPDAVDGVVAVLADAFHDYPVMRYVLGSDRDESAPTATSPGTLADSYARRLERLIRFFVMARVLRGEVLLGIRSRGVLAASALISRPGMAESPPELTVLREETWAALGREARSRYERFGEAANSVALPEAHHHLNMIGVRGSAQGSGMGRSLLEAVHLRSAQDETSTGVSLTTEAPGNVPLYERFGYRVVGSVAVEDALTTWVMFRPRA